VPGQEQDSGGQGDEGDKGKMKAPSTCPHYCEQLLAEWTVGASMTRGHANANDGQWDNGGMITQDNDDTHSTGRGMMMEQGETGANDHGVICALGSFLYVCLFFCQN